jgi:4'-phosphopantetheinyl transferase
VPAEGELHVWRADLHAVADELTELLSDEERARGQRMLRDRDRELWRRSRGVLRALLGRYLQLDPRTVRLAATPHGKPVLADDPQELHFNLSHSGDLALYAFSATVSVGVDVELERRHVDVLAVAARTFGPAEAERLRGLDPSVRRREFLRAWVRHEAELKCLGVGIGGADVDLAGPRPWIAELDAGPRGAGAVAAGCEPLEIRHWEWASPVRPPPRRS